MTHEHSLPHIYQRTVSATSNDSLSLIAQLILPGQTMLDLGMGAGGLGEFVSKQFELVADGVTINPLEAKIAQAWYRRSLVADLETANLAELLQGESYDCIVCADVLEHLKFPEILLQQCKKLLNPGGKLITSVPNVGYSGLLAELLMGDFRYRPEGLLDNTHLRFFTRKSLQRFFSNCGWQCLSTRVTQRNLLESEFKIAFDLLPPAVARHLLALPDASTYQFISILQPTDSSQPEDAISNDKLKNSQDLVEPCNALFSSTLYMSTNGQYDEREKLVAVGLIGQAQQHFVFNIPAREEPYTNFRFDPADRPGFFKLYSLRMSLPDNKVIWQWVSGENSFCAISQSPRNQMLISSMSDPTKGIILSMHGDDPWLQLPLPQNILDQISATGAQLEVSSGWPMSADYLQASLEINFLRETYFKNIDNINKIFQSTLTKKSFELETTISKLAQINITNTDLNSQLSHIRIANADLNHQIYDLTQTSNKLQAEKLAAIALQHTTAQECQKYEKLYIDLQTHLQTIEHSTLFRLTRPIVYMKMQLDWWLGKFSPKSHEATPEITPASIPLPTHPIDIIVPIYKGLEDTRCCIESVLNSKCKSDWRLILIDDCSPEPALSQWLSDLASREPRVNLLVNSENLGFVATVNRGMALSSENDVLLLNSDTEVANDWLDRIVRAGYSQPHVATVTPFSNNATICSYPLFCQSNKLPIGFDTTKLDLLFAKYLSGKTVNIPTGIGFCMYIRRQCLKEVGLFDVARFGKGYGEENDFCVRAQNMGWLNLHALDTFVWHAGGISFGDSKSERELQAIETLRELHPRYEVDVQNYLKADPSRSARMLIDIARITGSGKPVVLNVTHNRDGGTLRHIHEIENQLVNLAVFLILSPAPKGVRLNLSGVSEAFELHFNLPQEFNNLVETLRLLQVKHIHFHHLLGHDQCIFELPTQLRITHDFTAHDYYSYCPQISLTDHADRYCGEKGLQQCNQCLQRNPAPNNLDIKSWRNRHSKLLNSARYVFAPSQDTAVRIHNFVPSAHVQVLPHMRLFPNVPGYPLPKLRRITPDQPLKIAVLGALSRIKGADVLESVATLAANTESQIEFHLIGFAYRSLKTQPKAALTVHGAYEDQDLHRLLDWLRPDVVWFPAVWPETYSYTLSACLEKGLPIVAPNIGAFSERLQDRDWTWLCDWQQPSRSWVAFFEMIRKDHFCTGISPIPVGLRSPVFSTEMTVDYFGNYLVSLDATIESDAAELTRRQQLIDSFQSCVPPPAAVIKSSALQAIIHLRAMAALSPMTKLIPMHMQRRIKSWLKK